MEIELKNLHINSALRSRNCSICVPLMNLHRPGYWTTLKDKVSNTLTCHPETLCANLHAESDQETLAKLAELDFVATDLERANARVATVERRNVRSLCSKTIIVVMYFGADK